MITLFNLTNALSMFQKYINSTLKNFLNEFVSVYLDDIFVFFFESLSDHRQKITKILKCLRQTNLQIDIDKCEFEITSTKYLKFIVETDQSVRMNSNKIKTIMK